MKRPTKRGAMVRRFSRLPLHRSYRLPFASSLSDFLGEQRVIYTAKELGVLIEPVGTTWEPDSRGYTFQTVD